MPVSVSLVVCGQRAWPALRACPAVARADVERADGADRIDLTELALRDNPYHEGRIALSDAGSLAWLPRDAAPSLDLGDLRPRGARRAFIAGTVRPRLLAWLRSVAFATRTELRLVHWHERGDWPYECATWCWYPAEGLWWQSWDGGAEVRAEACAVRCPRDDVRFDLLATLLRGVVVGR